MEVMMQGGLALMRSAVTGEVFPLPEGYDMETAYPLLKKHHMDALIYEGAVRCGIDPKLPVMQQLFQRYCRHLLVSEGQQRLAIHAAGDGRALQLHAQAVFASRFPVEGSFGRAGAQWQELQRYCFGLRFLQ